MENTREPCMLAARNHYFEIYERMFHDEFNSYAHELLTT